jgi:site-specific recombinase XerD
MTNVEITRPAPLPIAMEDDFGPFAESFLLRWDGITRYNYRDDIRMFLSWCQIKGYDPYVDIRRPHLEMYMEWMKSERHNAPATIKRRIGTIRQFYDLALDDDLVMKNPARMLRVPKVHIDFTVKVALEDFEVTRLLEAACDASPSDYALCCLMAYCGLRVQETVELNVEDIWLEHKGVRALRFRAKGSTWDIVPMPDVVVRAVEAAAGDRQEGPLFLNGLGVRQNRRGADRVVKRVAKKAGITRVISPHTLRHSSIVSAIDAGVPLRDVQLSARHRDISTTIRLYDRGRHAFETHSAHTLADIWGTADGQ